jgi:hypothetical protein
MSESTAWKLCRRESSAASPTPLIHVFLSGNDVHLALCAMRTVGDTRSLEPD